MGKRGPRPTPKAILELRGSKRARYGKRAKEASPELGIPTAPTWLDREAKAEWRRVSKLLDEMTVLAITDRSALALMCQAWSDFLRLKREVKKEGETFKTSTGYLAKNPKVTIMNEAFQRWYKLMIEFGLTPSARAGVMRSTAAGVVQPPAPKRKPKGKARFFQIGIAG